MTMKTCLTCGLTQDTKNFSKNSRNADGLQHHCRRCHRAITVKRLEARKAAYVPPADGCKVCSKCKERKPLEDFCVVKALPDGRNHYCKACAVERSKVYFQDHKEARLAYDAAYKQTHRKRINEQASVRKKAARAAARETPVVCPGCEESYFREKNRKTKLCPACQDTVDRLRTYAYGLENREAILKRMREQYSNQAHVQERKRLYMQEWNRKNGKGHRAELYARRKDDPEFQAMVAAARSTFRAPYGNTSSTHVQHLYRWQRGCCFYCSTPLVKGHTHIEHIVPLSLGGSANDHNIVLACKECNLSKNAFVVEIEWPMPKARKNLGVVSTLQKEAPYNVTVLSSFWASERILPTEEAQVVMDPFVGSGRLVVWDYEWLTRKEAIIAVAAAKRGEAPRYMARKLTVNAIPPQQAREFLNRHHLMGAREAGTHLGLVDTGGVLHGVASFIFTKGEWELVRLAFDGAVTGGFSRLVEAFFRRTNAPSLFSYVDGRHGDGHGYEAIGFTDLGVSGARSYWYATPTGIINRFSGSPQSMQAEYKKSVEIWLPDISETVLNAANGRFRLYGVAQKRYRIRK